MVSGGQYYLLKEEAVGPYGYKWAQAGDEAPHPNLTLTVRRYAQADIDPSQRTFSLNGGVVTDTYVIQNLTQEGKSLRDYVNVSKIREQFDR